MKNYIELTGYLSSSSKAMSFMPAKDGNPNKDVATFSIAVDTKKKANEEDKSNHYEFVNCVCFGATARMMQQIINMDEQMRKDRKFVITVSGKIDLGYYKDGVDSNGNPIKVFVIRVKVICDEVEILDANYKPIFAGQVTNDQNNGQYPQGNNGQFAGANGQFNGGQFNGGQFNGGAGQFNGGQFNGGKFNGGQFNGGAGQFNGGQFNGGAGQFNGNFIPNNSGNAISGN